jgi:hypothetical protein
MICATQRGGGDGRWRLMHGSTGQRAFEFADQKAYFRGDSIRTGIEFIGLTRCIYGHKGNY